VEPQLKGPRINGYFRGQMVSFWPFFCLNLNPYERGVIPMICDTIRKGSECGFMSANGCSYNGGACHELVEACQGCGRSSELDSGWYCTACPEPAIKWKNGNCNLATHVTTTTTTSKTKLNPLKASKRASR
jgi:hypothetical protein